ncbi:hydrolase 1, exosortase A system-associated [Sphingomonas donggukensis]|uniref:Hydrolase 1, exosortase A system-associated n=1 Tax=Sphingomonas donggukensis TaxID=2949093 RepID=A0ABY4U2K5_9SPHN|nr:hydrolase 1, exosortase A system-associated [Sphingomonas donggukensis]URW76783.1 hydrolase 1, exosortase A system-associated [Sphingomonas donggukensis]
MRRLIEFASKGNRLVGTLDVPDGGKPRVGVLIVSGGNEIRIGAHRGMAALAHYLAANGVAAFRFDRSGIGDASGENAGFLGSKHDIFNASLVFGNETETETILGFGNCDAASALALFHAEAGIDALLLSNPWTGGTEDTLPAAAAIKARYAERLRDPREWLRLAKGGVNIAKVFGGLAKIAKSRSEDRYLVDRMAAALANSNIPATILLAERDNTAIAFRDAWAKCRGAPTLPIRTIASDSHSYASAADKDWLFEQVLAAAKSMDGGPGEAKD